MARDIVSAPGHSAEPPSSAERPAQQPPTPAAAAPALRSTAASTFLDASSVFEGVIRSSEPMRLDGRVKGEIHCESSVVIGESARIEATIRADAVAIAGEVKGGVHAGRKITLAATARVVGDLTTPAIAIEEGAELEGRAQIGTRPPASASQADPRVDTRASAPPAPSPSRHSAPTIV
jgi:cytoskeletal protein CcmA (bactofilin family)